MLFDETLNSYITSRVEDSSARSECTGPSRYIAPYYRSLPHSNKKRLHDQARSHIVNPASSSLSWGSAAKHTEHNGQLRAEGDEDSKDSLLFHAHAMICSADLLLSTDSPSLGWGDCGLRNHSQLQQLSNTEYSSMAILHSGESKLQSREQPEHTASCYLGGAHRFFEPQEKSSVVEARENRSRRVQYLISKRKGNIRRQNQ